MVIKGRSAIILALVVSMIGLKRYTLVLAIAMATGIQPCESGIKRSVAASLGNDNHRTRRKIFNEGTSGGHFVNVFCHGTRERIHAHGNILENKPSIAMSTTSHSEVEMSRCKGVKDDTDDLLGALGSGRAQNRRKVSDSCSTLEELEDLLKDLDISSRARSNISQELEKLALEVKIRKLSLEKKNLDQQLSFLHQQCESLFREYHELRSSMHTTCVGVRSTEVCPCSFSHSAKEYSYSKERIDMSYSKMKRRKSLHRRQKSSFSKLPTNLPEVSTKHLLGFVYDLAPHWDLIGHGLGVGDVVRLLQRNARGADSLCMEMFARWIERSPDANWRTLVKVLARLQMDRVVKKIVDYLHQSQSVDHCEQFSPELPHCTPGPKISTEHLVEFVNDLAPHWDLIGYGLGVGDVVRTVQQHAYAPDSVCMQVLESWFQRDPKADWRTFCLVLAKLKLFTVVKKLQVYLVNCRDDNFIFSS